MKTSTQPILSSPRKRGPMPTRTKCKTQASVAGAMGPRFRGGDTWGWRALAAGCVGALLSISPLPAVAQTQQDADRFIKLLQSYDYEKLIGSKVLETDQQMSPPCQGERKIESRQLVTVTEAPQFIA